MGKLHGTLAKAGKVKKQTPKIEKTPRARKIPKGRAYKRIIYNRKFANKIAAVTGGPQMKQKSPNWHAGRKELIEEEKKKAKAQKDQRASQKQRK